MTSSSGVCRGRSFAGVLAFLAVIAALLGGGSVAGASSVGSVSVSVSPAVAGATGARWTVSFTATSALAAGTDSISLTGPAGTVFPNSCSYTIIDTTPDPDVEWGACAGSMPDTNQVTLTVGNNVAAGHALQVVVDDVENKSTSGSKTLSVSTSTDTTPVNANFTLAAGPTAVSGVGITALPAVAGATGARWTVTFTNTNALNYVYSRVYVSAPVGTVFPNSCSYQLIDTTADVNLSGCTAAGGGTNAVELYVYGDVPAGHVLQLTVDDVVNPPNAGSYPVGVSTSSDRSPVSANAALTTGPTAVSGVGITALPPVAGATGARWTVTFTNTNALNSYYSRLRVSAPAGTVFSASCAYRLVDTTPNPDVTLSSCPFTGGGTNEVELYVNGDVPAGHALVLTADDVVNPPNAGSYPVAVSTSSDRSPVSANAALSAGPTAVSGVGVTASPPVAGATGARWTVSFTNTNALNNYYSHITLAAPAGTVFTGNCSYQLVDTTPNPDVVVSGCPTAGGGTNEVELYLGGDVPAGHALVLTADDVVNPPNAGSYPVAVSTTSDRSPVSTNVALTSGPTAVSALSISALPPVAGATGARWTASFTNTNALHSYYSRITLAAPSGTKFPTGCSYQLIDTTPNPDVVVTGCPTAGGGTNEVELHVYGDVPAGHSLVLTADDVVNPPNAGSYPVAISTSSDQSPLTTNVALTSGPTAVTGAGVAIDNTLPGATGVTYTIAFTNTNALNYYYSRVRVAAPAGTVFPSWCAYQLIDTTPNPDVTLSSCPTAGAGTNEIEFYVGGDVPAGHALQLVATDVTNPDTSGAKTLTISTSSDQTPVAIGYTLGLGVSTTALPSAQVGAAYSATLTATGGTGPYSWSMAPGSGPLPSGLSLNSSTGVISGTPATGTGGTYPNLVFRVKDATNATSDSLPLTLNVGSAPVIETQSEVTFTPGVFNSFQVWASGIPAPALSVSGTLPSGVTFTDNGNGTATIAGTPPVGTSGDHPLVITATNDIGSDTQDFTLGIAKAASYAWVTSSVNPSKVGQSVTFTATVAGGGGTVEFFDGATSLGTATLSDGQATLATAALTVGTHDITVVYSGDGSYLGSTSPKLTQSVVERPGTTTALVSSVNPSLTGQTVMFTATVTGADVTPTGTVTFLEGASVLASVGLDVNGQAFFSTSSLAVGDHPITAVYGGDSAFQGSASSVLTQKVTKASTTTAVTSSLNPSGSGAQVTFTATVAAVAPSSGAPSGTVEFFDGATSLGTASLNAFGVTTFATSALTIGAHEVTAVYAGDTSYVGSTSPKLNQVVNPKPLTPTTTSAVSSPNPSVFGQTITITATVAGEGGTPTGSVTFFDGANAMGSSVLDGTGTAVFPVTGLAVGDRQITAVYGGDTTFAPSTSAVLTQKVDKASTTVALTSSLNPSTAGQNVTFTAKVAAVAPGAGVPGGTVEFRDGATSLGTVTLVGGEATVETSALTAGTHPITAVYSGSSSFTGSTSTSLDQVVMPVPLTPTATVLASSLNPSGHGAEVTFTATVTADGSTPVGTVELFDDTTSLGNATLNGAGVATLSTSTLTVGTHPVKAVYSGSPAFAASTSAVLDQVVEQTPLTATATSLGSSVNPSVSGQSVELTSTVTGAGGTPTGSVQFRDGAKVLGSGTVDGTGTATLTTDSLAVGDHDLTAVYGGDDTFETSTSAVLVQVVNPAATATAVASSKNPSKDGQSVTFTVQVTAVDPGAGTPGGTVEIRDGATSLDTLTLDGSGKATYATSALTVGTHPITAVYSGDASFVSSTSPSLEQVVEETPLTQTATAVTSSKNPSAYGETVTFTATVTAEGATPAGTVEFRDGATVLGAAVLDGAGKATLPAGNLAVGDHPITAAFTGDDPFADSTSAVLTQKVDPAPTAVELTSSANPSTLGQPVMITAKVTSGVTGVGTPTGSVQFLEGATVLGTVPIGPAGTAEIPLGLPVGSHPITAVYAGDGTFAASTSEVLTQVVSAAPLKPTSTALSSTLNPSKVGQSVTFSATVEGEGGTPTGTVEFRDGTTVIGSAPLDGTGKASLSTSDLAAGEHRVVAVYGGDDDFAGSTSPEVVQVVEKDTTCQPLTTIRSVNGTARLANGASLSVDLKQVRFFFIRKVWVGEIVYRDASNRVLLVSNVFTTRDVVKPIADACRGASVRVSAVNFGRVPWRLGTLEMQIVDRSPDAPDAVMLQFPRMTPVSTTVVRGDLTVR